jgi:hypothetical protein
MIIAVAPIASFAQSGDASLVEVLIESASTPAQHQALANYYRSKEAAAKKEAELHRAMGKTYSGEKAIISAAQMEHCSKLASLDDSMAAEYEQMAAAHETAAKK